MGIRNMHLPKWLSTDALWAFAAGATSLLLHVVPFLLYGNHPLGYDTGFYRRYLTEPFVTFPNTPVPGLGDDALVPRIIFDFLRVIHLPTDVILYGSYLAWFAILPVLAFYFLKTTLGTRGAIIGAFLLALSPVSYTAFWFMLWKNAWALLLLLSAFIALEKRSWQWVIVLELLMTLSHKTTAIMYILTLLFLVFFQKERFKEIAMHVCIAGAAFLAVNWSLAERVMREAPAAVFLGMNDYLTLSVPFIVAALLGCFLWKEVRPPKTLLAFSCAGLIFPLLQLPFYERVLVYTDVALALLAAFGAEYLIRYLLQSSRTISWSVRVLVLCALAGLLAGNLENQIKSLQPLLSEHEIAQIEETALLVPENATLLTTTGEAPWFEGFTKNHIAAPGMLQDTHNLVQWNAFWDATSTEAKTKFLATFPAPFYISTLNDFGEIIGTPPPCVTSVTPLLMKSECGASD